MYKCPSTKSRENRGREEAEGNRERKKRDDMYRLSEKGAMALELDLAPAISFVGEALLMGSDGRGTGSRCSEVCGEEEAVTVWRCGPMVLPAAGCALSL
jgi:hypothetical protein